MVVNAAETWAPAEKLGQIADRYTLDRELLAGLAGEVREAGCRGEVLGWLTGRASAGSGSGGLAGLDRRRAQRLAADLTCLWLTSDAASGWTSGAGA